MFGFNYKMTVSQGLTEPTTTFFFRHMQNRKQLCLKERIAFHCVQPNKRAEENAALLKDSSSRIEKKDK